MTLDLFWQYKFYADTHGGFRDLCKLSLDLRMPVPIIQVWYAILIVKITLRLLKIAAN